MTVKPEIVEAVAKRIDDARDDYRLMSVRIADAREHIEAYHAVMRERREEVVEQMRKAFAEAPRIRDMEPHAMRAVFNAIFGEEQ
jgi:hypothetical protein